MSMGMRHQKTELELFSSLARDADKYRVEALENTRNYQIVNLSSNIIVNPISGV